MYVFNVTIFTKVKYENSLPKQTFPGTLPCTGRRAGYSVGESETCEVCSLRRHTCGEVMPALYVTHSPVMGTDEYPRVTASLPDSCDGGDGRCRGGNSNKDLEKFHRHIMLELTFFKNLFW